MHHKGLEDYFVMSLSGCREHLFVRKLGGTKWGNLSIQSWGLYIFSKSMTSSKGSEFIYFDWLSGLLVLSGKFISPLGGRALENQLFHQYSCPSYLWASEIFSDHWALGEGVKKSHLALNHSSVHCWNGACAVTLSKIYKFKCILNEFLKHEQLHHEELDALLSNDNGIYVISLCVVIMVSFHRTAQIWAESSIILKLVFFFCFSPGVVFLPCEGEKTRLGAVPLCYTSPGPPWMLPLSPHALFPLQMWTLSIPPSPAPLSAKCPARVLQHVFRNE